MGEAVDRKRAPWRRVEHECSDVRASFACWTVPVLLLGCGAKSGLRFESEPVSNPTDRANVVYDGSFPDMENRLPMCRGAPPLSWRAGEVVGVLLLDRSALRRSRPLSQGDDAA